jgi:hypothetical protein
MSLQPGGTRGDFWLIKVDRTWPVLGHSDAVDPQPDLANDRRTG